MWLFLAPFGPGLWGPAPTGELPLATGCSMCPRCEGAVAVALPPRPNLRFAATASPGGHDLLAPTGSSRPAKPTPVAGSRPEVAWGAGQGGAQGTS